MLTMLKRKISDFFASYVTSTSQIADEQAEEALFSQRQFCRVRRGH